MYKIIDTNIILLDAYNVITLGADGATIVIPETVLDETDSKKSGFSEIAFQAREFGRLLARAKDVEVRQVEGLTISVVELNGTTIHIVSISTYPKYDGAADNIINDRKIIEVATQYTNIGMTPVTFITADIACKHRAKSLGLTVQEPKDTEDTDIAFIQVVDIPDAQFGTLHNSAIMDIVPDHKPNYFNYKFINEHTNQVKLATISNGKIDVIGKDTEKELRRQDINPANSEQLFFSRALQDTSIDINIVEAKAGSGKTAVAVSNGIRMVKQGHYDSIMYVRASVSDLEKSEEVGFLPGLEEKFNVYLHPLEDTLDFIVRNKLKDSKLKADQLEERVSEDIIKLKTQCSMEAVIGLGLRGRTFHNTYIIIDEAQNQSKASLQKMLTRVGQNCKVVVIGSNKQIDNPYITKYTNGLSTLLNACTKTHERVNLHAVSLPKVLRGPIAEFSEDLYSSS